MELLLNPNIAYLLLAGGLVLIVLSLLSPGTGVLEIAAVFAILLAGWEVYNLPVNGWALLILLIGGVLFVASIRKDRGWALLAGSILALVLGSAFLFRSERWWIPAVNPILAALVAALSAGFFWFAGRKILEASTQRPSHDLDALIGAVGEARTAIHQEGTVQVQGELWSARSEQPIPLGAHVRVVQREGLILVVEEIPESQNTG